jgi:hypothetical protein
MLSAKGTNGTIHFDGQTVTIERTGFSAPAPAFGGSIAEELGKLAALRQQGIISDADFEQAKARLIGG